MNTRGCKEKRGVERSNHMMVAIGGDRESKGGKREKRERNDGGWDTEVV